MTDPDLTVDTVLADDLREWLTSELRFPVLAINANDGPPNQSVMWFELDPDGSDTILMNTMVRRLKYRQLQADPRVSVLFESGLKWVGMRGVAELDADREPALAPHPAPRPPLRGEPGALRGPGAGDHPHPHRQGDST